MFVNPEALFNTFHVLTVSDKGTSPINSQQKLDKVVLTLVNPQTGEISINSPYNITVALHCNKAVAALVGTKEEEK